MRVCQDRDMYSTEDARVKTYMISSRAHGRVPINATTKLDHTVDM